MLLQTYTKRQSIATEIHHEFAKYHSPISMAASEQTGALLWTLLDVLGPKLVIETGSGYTTIILAEWLKHQRALSEGQQPDSTVAMPQVFHVEENESWKYKVLQHLDRVGLQAGTFIDYPDLYKFALDKPFFALLDGLRSERPIVARWLVDVVRNGVLLIDDAQEAANPEVRESIEILEQSNQGIMVDLSLWTTDIYSRSAKLFIGFEAGVSSNLLRELASSPPNQELDRRDEIFVQEPIAEPGNEASIDSNPLITIVITCYNKINYIGQAIESALTQTYSPLEVIVVNDGSADDSSATISEFAELFPGRFKVINQENQGVSKARDAGVQVATGKYVVLLDGDDFLASDAVQSWYEYARQHPEFAVIYSDAIRVDEQGRVTGSHIPKEQRLKVEGDILSSVLGWGIVLATSLIDREKINEVGGYSFYLNLKGHDDYFLYLRLLIAGYQFGYLDRFLLFYRDVSASISKNVQQGNTFKYKALQYVYSHNVERMVAAAQELTALGLEERRERTRLEHSITQLLREHQSEMTSEKERVVEQFHAIQAANESEIQRLQQKYLEQQDAIRTADRVEFQKLQQELREQQDAIRTADRVEFQKLQQELEEVRRTALQHASRVRELEATIAAMQATRGWRYLTVWWRLKRRVLPTPENRLRIKQLNHRVRLTLRHDGPIALADRTVRWLRGERRYHTGTNSNVTPIAHSQIPMSQLESRMQHDTSVADVVRTRYPDLEAIRGFQVSQPDRRLNLVTDSVNSGSLFGGVATSLIFAALLAEKWDCDLRVVTRTEKAHTRNVGNILQANGISFARNIEFLFADQRNSESIIPLGERDVFLTTSWWTTESVRRTVNSNRILYILQEDERAFYPFGDDHVRCTSVLRDPEITTILNSQLLYDYMIDEGFHNIQRNGYWFEPSWPSQLFYFEETASGADKRDFFYYARPNHARNLFHLGIQVIETAITRDILKPSEWDFHFVGRDIPNIRLASSVNPMTHQDLMWADYARLVRKMDLGLSLMYSPHPSYPPIDLAASGAVAVTNTYRNKQSLRHYSENIVCRDLDVDALVQGLEEGVILARNTEQRLQNYRSNGLLRNWRTSFAPILDGLATFMDMRNG